MSTPNVASSLARGEREQHGGPLHPATASGARLIPRAARAFMAAGARVLNPLIVRLAGRPGVPLLVVLHHRGRRSGRAYATPIGARPMTDGFVVPLTFGERADWYRNLRAAGGGLLRWHGADYSLVGPEVVDWPTARPAFNAFERFLLQTFSIDQFVRLRHAPAAEHRPR